MLKLRTPFHWFAGGVAGWAGLSHPLLSFNLILIFVLYQAFQEASKWLEAKRRGEPARIDSQWDILEFAVSYFIGLAGIILWRLFV